MVNALFASGTVAVTAGLNVRYWQPLAIGQSATVHGRIAPCVSEVIMSHALKRLLYWSPRVACILFTLFLSLFALDVFGEGYGFWLTIQALLVHLVPVFVITAVLLLTWRHEWLAAVLFVGLALLYASDAWGQEHWTAVAVISGSLAVIGGLFLLSWIFRRELAAR